MPKRTVEIDSLTDAGDTIADASSILTMLEEHLLQDQQPDPAPLAYIVNRVRHDLDGVVEFLENQRMGRAA